MTFEPTKLVGDFAIVASKVVDMRSQNMVAQAPEPSFSARIHTILPLEIVAGSVEVTPHPCLGRQARHLYKIHYSMLVSGLMRMSLDGIEVGQRIYPDYSASLKVIQYVLHVGRLGLIELHPKKFFCRWCSGEDGEYCNPCPSLSNLSNPICRSLAG